MRLARFWSGTRCSGRQGQGASLSGARAMAVLVLCFVCLALAVGCRHQSPSVGPLREITVVTNHRPVLDDSLRAILQQQIPTPQFEPEFELRFFQTDDFQTWSLFRTVLLVGTTRDTIIRGILGPRADSLPDGDFGFFRIPNPWAMNQEVLILTVTDDSLLVPGLGRYAERLYSTSRDAVLRHVSRAIYHRGINRPATDSLREQFAFSVDVPGSWWLNQEAADSNFVFTFGHHPDRNVFIYWEERERELVAEELYELRDELTMRYYDEDFVLDTLRSWRFIEFLGDSCLRIYGIWQNREYAVGGPFTSYGFNYQGRFFFVDGLVFNPGRKKMDGLIQAEAVMRTFIPH